MRVVILIVWFRFTCVEFLLLFVSQALMELFETEEIKELQLTGHHLPSLADLALKQTAQVLYVSHFERGSGLDTGGHHYH